jgi:hypothetical protein
MKDLNHICYNVTFDSLIENYVQTNYTLDTVVVVHNPNRYKHILKELNLYFDEVEVFFDKIMIILVENIIDGIELIRNVNPHSGPVCSLWVEGQFFTDNIEDNLSKGI